MRTRAGERLLQPVASKRLSLQLLRHPNHCFHHTQCSHETLLLIILIAIFLLLSVCFVFLLLLLLTSGPARRPHRPNESLNQSENSTFFHSKSSSTTGVSQSFDLATLDQLIEFDAQKLNSIDENLFNRLLNLPPPFRFLLNPSDRCESQTKFLLLVHSHVQHLEARAAIRQSWANERLQQSSRTKLVFLLGQLPALDSKLERQVEQEFLAHRDLVSGNFVDSYRNLTYKHLMGFNWALQFCSQARFIVKSDDDAFVDLKRLIHMLQNDLLPTVAQTRLLQPDQQHAFDSGHSLSVRLNNVYSNRNGELTPVQHLKDLSIRRLQQKLRSEMRSLSSDHLPPSEPSSNSLLFLGCSLFSNGTRTRRTGKWALKTTEYPDEYLPPYCSGLAYVLNTSAARFLYLVAQLGHQPLLHIDDLFVTGLTLQRLVKSLNKSDQLVMFDWSSQYSYEWRRLQKWTQQSQIQSPPLITDLGECPHKFDLMRLAAAQLQL